jgi:hypothetical protein
MSFSKQPGNQSTEVLMQQAKRSQDVKSSFDVTDDLEHVTTLSYISAIPLNDRHPAQSTTSLPPSHGDDLSQPQDGREKDSQQAYFNSHSQDHHHRQRHPRGASWDLLGGARKFNEAYEHFDPRNASEQHLVFADGDLPNSKVSYGLHLFDTHGSKNALLVCPLLPISFECINRDAMDLVHHPCLGHPLDPWNSRSNGVP